jgi:hypothetical protein
MVRVLKSKMLQSIRYVARIKETRNIYKYKILKVKRLAKIDEEGERNIMLRWIITR